MPLIENTVVRTFHEKAIRALPTSLGIHHIDSSHGSNSE
jgi:hypothetical protein